MMRAREQNHMRNSLGSSALPSAPMAMPDQILERPRARGTLFTPLLRLFAWK